MNHDRDIGPDEVYLRREVATQTEADVLWEKANQIVKNFNKIEKYWKQVEQSNNILLFCTISLSLIVLLR